MHRFPPLMVVAVGALGLAASIAIQFATRKYLPWIYWLTVVMVAVFGTMAADVLHVGLGVPYWISTCAFSGALAIVFASWYASEGTLSIHSIYTHRREAFYWATVLATFALGTAAGDLTATTLHLGYFGSGLLFAGVMVLPALALWWFHLNEVTAFWFAYVITRPLGASFADWTAVSPTRGGLNWGAGTVSIGLTILIAGLVGYLTVARPEVRRSVRDLTPN